MQGAAAKLSLDAAIEAYEQSRPDAAEAVCRRLLAAPADRAAAANVLAVIACDRGQPQEALNWLRLVAPEAKATAAWHNARARALHQAGCPDQAEAELRLAWSLRPGLAPVAHNLASLLRARGDIDGAITWLRRAAEANPASADIASYLADTLVARGDYAAATRHYRQALHLRPGHAPSLNNLGLALSAQGLDQAAKPCFAKAALSDPGGPDAHYNLGCLTLLDGQQDAARAHYARALAASPLHGHALWARCMAELPVTYGHLSDIARQRNRYADELARLECLASDPAAATTLAAAAGASQPFFLPYQGHCDRTLQSRYGQLMARLLARGPVALPPPPAPGEPIRLGIVSGFFRDHTIWHLMLHGWLRHLDRTRFQLTCYQTAPAADPQTAAARRLCPRFVEAPPEALRDAILANRPHALLYPEIGIDPLSARLAAERLAPLQCAAWGQPQTTGLPTIDLFFSSQAMEPPEAAGHYTEYLVPLPGIGVCYEPDGRTAAPCTRAEFGIRGDAILFWSGQALSKYHPAYDDIIARIAAELPNSQFLFVAFAKSRRVTEQFRTRLSRALTARGLDPARHIVIAPPMTQERFLGSVRLADIVLDSIGWSGGKSTLDILAEAPPIITHPGPLMRSRHTAGILATMAVTETTAPTLDDYVQLAIHLARNEPQRTAIRHRMEANRATVQSNPAPIRTMEDIITRKVYDLCTT